jgi:AraC-like DNA-binding protein
MEYREYAPSAALRRYVHCFWSLRVPQALTGKVETIFPDARPELVFHIGQPFADAGTGIAQAPALLVGQLSRPVRLRATGAIDVFGVRLRHAACESVTAIPANETAEAITPAELLRADVRTELWHALAEDAPGTRRVAIAEGWLLERIRDRVDTIAEAAVSAIVSGRPFSGYGLSQRQLRRRFLAATGLRPRLFFRIARFQRALAVIESQPLAAASAEAGYADQSHLTREFREFAGCTPLEYLAAASLGREFAQSSVDAS